MRHTNKKKTGSTGILLVFGTAIIALILGGSVPVLWAEEEILFDVAKLYFELNNSDGDLGIHGLIDGEPWKKLEIEDPREREILDISVKGRLRRQGLTELFFESAEPSFDELSQEKFFKRFPEGEYEIEGETLEGDELESEVNLRHKMPAPAVVSVNDVEIVTTDECADVEDPEPTEVSLPVIIKWSPVTHSHPDIGKPNNSPIKVVLYQIVVEYDLEDEEGNEATFVFSADFPPSDGEMSVTVPSEFLPDDGETEFKVEVLVRAKNGNQTAVESCPYVLVTD